MNQIPRFKIWSAGDNNTFSEQALDGRWCEYSDITELERRVAQEIVSYCVSTCMDVQEIKAKIIDRYTLTKGE